MHLDIYMRQWTWTIIGSYSVLSPIRQQTIVCTKPDMANPIGTLVGLDSKW